MCPEHPELHIVANNLPSSAKLLHDLIIVTYNIGLSLEPVKSPVRDG